MAGWSYVCVFRALIACIILENAFAIDCYVCSSTIDDHCGEEPDGARLILNNKVGSGCAACVKTFQSLGTIWSKVQRSCFVGIGVDECSNTLGYGSCSCTTTFCNNNTVISGSSLLISAMMFLALACIYRTR